MINYSILMIDPPWNKATGGLRKTLKQYQMKQKTSINNRLRNLMTLSELLIFRRQYKYELSNKEGKHSIKLFYLPWEMRQKYDAIEQLYNYYSNSNSNSNI